MSSRLHIVRLLRFGKNLLAFQLPGSLEIGDYLLTENIGAYSIASSMTFNGFDGARIIHTNLRRSAFCSE